MFLKAGSSVASIFVRSCPTVKSDYFGCSDLEKHWNRVVKQTTVIVGLFRMLPTFGQFRMLLTFCFHVAASSGRGWTKLCVTADTFAGEQHLEVRAGISWGVQDWRRGVRFGLQVCQPSGRMHVCNQKVEEATRRFNRRVSSRRMWTRAILVLLFCVVHQ